MTLELKVKDRGTNGARRILLERIDGTLEALDGRRAVSDKAIHEARKELKRARAVLRLWRDGLSTAAYRRENLALRDAGKPLTEVRDAKVMLDTVDDLVEHFSAAGNAIPLEPFCRLLRKERADLRRKVLGSPRELAIVRRNLRQARERIAHLPTAGDAWSVYGCGLMRTYRRGRRAFAAARQERSVERLHDWRKSAKYLRHQLQVLGPLWPGPIGELADQAHKLTEYLGEDHDLSILRDRVAHSSDVFRDASAVEAFIALIDRRRLELQNRALALGERLYQEKPKQLRRRFEDYWLNWQRENGAKSAAVITGMHAAA